MKNGILLIKKKKYILNRHFSNFNYSFPLDDHLISIIESQGKYELKVDNQSFFKLPRGKNTNTNDAVTSNFISVKQLARNPITSQNFDDFKSKEMINKKNIDLSQDFEKFYTTVPGQTNNPILQHNQRVQNHIHQTNVPQINKQKIWTNPQDYNSNQNSNTKVKSPKPNTVNKNIQPPKPTIGMNVPMKDIPLNQKKLQSKQIPQEYSENSNIQKNPKYPTQSSSMAKKNRQNQIVQQNQEADQYYPEFEEVENPQLYPTQVQKNNPKENYKIDLLEQSAGGQGGLTNDLFADSQENDLFTATMLKPETNISNQQKERSKGFQKLYTQSIAESDQILMNPSPELAEREERNMLFDYDENANLKPEFQRNQKNNIIVNDNINQNMKEEEINRQEIYNNEQPKIEEEQKSRPKTWQDEMFDLLTEKSPEKGKCENKVEEKKVTLPTKNVPLAELLKNSQQPEVKNQFNTMQGVSSPYKNQFPLMQGPMMGMPNQMMDPNMMMMYMTNLMNMNMMMSGLRPPMNQGGNK